MAPDITSWPRGSNISPVRILNVPSFVHSTGVEVDCPELGRLTVDVAYGGNFYAIVEPQAGYGDLADFGADDIVRWSRALRHQLNVQGDYVHPEKPSVRGLSHVMWTGRPTRPEADGRNAVFYGDKGVDRSPCGTGTSARMAQLVARGELEVGDDFVHESIIGSLFHGRVEAKAKVGNHQAIVPSIEGWARITGFNTIFIDDRDPYAHGFQVA